MNRPCVRPLLALVLPALLLAPAADARITYKPKPSPAAAAPCEPLAGPAPDVAPRARDRVGINFTAGMLTTADSAVVQVCALVDSLGLVRQARIERAGTPYDSAAVDAVHWWQFEPARRNGRPVAARVSIAVTVHPPVDADPLTPDVLGMALSAEEANDPREALEAWTGTLARAGIHPTLGNEWVIRERQLGGVGGRDLVTEHITDRARALAARRARGGAPAVGVREPRRLEQHLVERVGEIGVRGA